jgi:hypothetical protein
MKWWGWLIIIGVGVLVVWVTIDSNRFSIGNFSHQGTKTEIPENEWKVVQQGDFTEMIRVEWDQKYGMTKTEYCRVVFQNASQYKLVAPWLNINIEKANTNNIRYTKEPYDSVKIKENY